MRFEFCIACEHYTFIIMTFGFLDPKTFKLIGFPTFWPWACLMKVIPEACRVH
jgi:hypothetical protein